ncbi:DUF2802 domain-containing protein [Chitinibacter sp. SCUT-21]|uniref:DUF2802 domain-containing protein n=1 Tax=Chitinibacter sp. SCUT-21 TaxID=2970891 RepID=UPI0035A680FF
MIVVSLWNLIIIFLFLVIAYALNVSFIYFRMKQNDRGSIDEILQHINDLQRQLLEVVKKIEAVKGLELNSICEDDAERGGGKIGGRDEFENTYARAIVLAQQGFSPEDLIVDCGLSRAEAELIVTIYRGAYKG